MRDSTRDPMDSVTWAEMEEEERRRWQENEDDRPMGFTVHEFGPCQYGVPSRKAPGLASSCAEPSVAVVEFSPGSTLRVCKRHRQKVEDCAFRDEIDIYRRRVQPRVPEARGE